MADSLVYTYNSFIHTVGFMKASMKTGNKESDYYNSRFQGTPISSVEMRYMVTLMEKAIRRMKAYRDTTKWHRNNKYFTMTVTEKQHWMSYSPHYEAKIKFARVKFTISMKMVFNCWSNQYTLV